MRRKLLYPLGLVVLGVVVLTTSPVFARQIGSRTRSMVLVPPSSPAPVTVTGVVVSAVPGVQHCQGPQRSVAPNETFVLTCNVTSPLGGNQMLILPEVWFPGNGCITTVDKPRVVVVGNNSGVSATFTNRCGSGYMGTEGGLAWLIYQIQ